MNYFRLQVVSKIIFLDVLKIMGMKFTLHIIQLVYKRDPYNPKKISFIIYIIHLYTLSSVKSKVFWNKDKSCWFPELQHLQILPF
jgi:hypothetical protein